MGRKAKPTAIKKAEGNPYEELTEGARADIEAKHKVMYGQFVGAVAKHRGVSSATVESDFGGGGMLLAEGAKTAGMVDRVATMQEVIAEMIAGQHNRRRRGMANRLKLAESTI